MPPTGSISEPSHRSVRCTRSAGRTKFSSGPTTVGPETTRMTPSMSAAPFDMPSSSAAKRPANAQVTGTPMAMSRTTTERVPPSSLRRFSPTPLSKRMRATASETIGWNSDPRRLLGLMSSVRAPAMKPTGSRTIRAGMRTRLARTCEPTASTTVRPKPKKMWSAVTARSYTLLGGHAPDVDRRSEFLDRNDQRRVAALEGLQRLPRGLVPPALGYPRDVEAGVPYVQVAQSREPPLGLAIPQHRQHRPHRRRG